MIESVLVGVTTAGVVVFHRSLVHWMSQWNISSSLGILGLGFIVFLMRKWILERRSGIHRFDGVSDLLIHIHTPSYSDSASRWGVQGLTSFFLALSGMVTGIEGAAMEWAQSLKMKLRPRSGRWFEQRRRTDTSSCIAAAMAAACGAPFAGVMLSMELGMGGGALTIGMTAVSAFLSAQVFLDWTTLIPYDFNTGLTGFRVLDWKLWGNVLFLSGLAAILGTFIVRAIRFSQEGLKSLTMSSLDPATLKLAVGVGLLTLAALLNRHAFLQSGSLMEAVLWQKYAVSEVALIICIQLFCFVIAVATFGSSGILFPLFVMGCLIGYCLNYWTFGDSNEFITTSGMISGAALWGAVLGAPLSGAVLSYELTGSVSLLLPCFISSLLAHELRKRLKGPTLVEMQLGERGIELIDGKIRRILESMTAGEVMEKGIEMILENETIDDLYQKMIQAKHPFFPVVNRSQEFLGLLTADMIQEGFLAGIRKEEGAKSAGQQKGAAKLSPLSEGSSPLIKLMEAKDLLYRSDSRLEPSLTFKSVRVDDRLSRAVRSFDEVPCIPVLDKDQKLLGLLFAYQVREAYDREVMRQLEE